MKQQGMCTYRCIGARRLEQVSKKRNESITKGRRKKCFFIYTHKVSDAENGKKRSGHKMDGKIRR